MWQKESWPIARWPGMGGDAMNQLSMIDPELGVILRDKGIARSINNAEDLEEDWSVKALSFLYEYAKTHDRFL